MAKLFTPPPQAALGTYLRPNVVERGVHQPRIVPKAPAQKREAAGILAAASLARQQQLGDVVVSVEFRLRVAAVQHLKATSGNLAFCFPVCWTLAFFCSTYFDAEAVFERRNAAALGRLVAHSARQTVDPLEERVVEPSRQLDQEHVVKVGVLAARGRVGFLLLLDGTHSEQRILRQLLHGHQLTAVVLQALVFILLHLVGTIFHVLQEGIGVWLQIGVEIGLNRRKRGENSKNDQKNGVKSY